MGRPQPDKQRTWVLKIGLAACSTIFSLLAVVLGLKIYASSLGIRDSDFRYENQIEMWRPDRVLGFCNKANFDGYCFGTIHVTTNNDGFRGQQPVSRQKTPGTTRIIGLGDSVMWGTSVNQEQSFLGILQTKLASRSQDVEVINAGVVGYSTVQEALYFGDRLLAFEPDVVLINFCENDLMPSEDPFNAIGEVYSKYLLEVVEGSDIDLTAREQELAYEFIQTFKPTGRPPGATAATLDERLRIVTKLCLEAPVRQIIRLANEHQIRLIFLFIPPRDPSDQYAVLSQQLKSLLDPQQVEYLDMQPQLLERAAGNATAVEESLPGFWDHLQESFVPDLHDIRVVHRFEEMHQNQIYIDFVHPSKKGNEIIAERIFQHLQ